MEMPFGKWKGELVEEVPRDYLRWLWDNAKLYGRLREAVAVALGIADLVDVVGERREPSRVGNAAALPRGVPRLLRELRPDKE